MKRLWVLGLLLCTISSAQEPKQNYVFTANLENDLIAVPSRDRHYTQGLHLTLMWPDDEVPIPVHPFAITPTLGHKDPIRKFGFEIGQDIYTPERISATALQRDDRPYAGWLYAGFVREDRSAPKEGIATLDRYVLQLGMIGPASLADDAQEWWHEIIQSPKPRGWRHQLDNEPGVLLRLDRKWRIMDLSQAGGLHLQMLPRAGVALGNVETSARAGVMLRLGANIPDEFGPVIPPGRGWYVFVDPGVRAVLYNAFLDGNLYRDSHSVSKENAVIEIRGGLVIQLGPSEISYTYVAKTDEFEKQDKNDVYGSLNYTYRF